MNTNNTLINTLSFDAGSTDTVRELLIHDLRKACAGLDRPEIKAAILPGWAKGAGIKLGDYRGQPSWPDNAGAAKKRFNRLIADICEGEASRGKEEKPAIEVDQGLIDEIQNLLAKYGVDKKQAQSACASAINSAFA
tara:strand:- start:183 stop:593 length:411 start_codon:yes stop_codon:yes gene_type:complete